MSLSLVQSRALLGLAAAAVTVEVHLANGLPSFTLVGLADVEVKEARERVRSAIQNSGLEFPNNKRIIVNSGAGGPAQGFRTLRPAHCAGHIGSQRGKLMPRRSRATNSPGSCHFRANSGQCVVHFAMSLALHANQVLTRLVLPPDSAEEAALVDGAQVYRARHLLDVVQHFLPSASTVAQFDEGQGGWTRLDAKPVVQSTCYPDLADVKGQLGARRALEIAAAGGHSVLLIGPPGAGKSMLAQRFAGLLPPMTTPEALQSAAVASLGGRFSLAHWMQRPTCHPHHTASAVALVGGGSPPRPGEISLAHNGVLFLDELPEFPRAALEALREPLETGNISISRAAMRAEFPARFQLIAAMNPCPCGYLGSTQVQCRCTPDQVARYQSKLSGPLLDRIDLHVEVPAVSAVELMALRPGESSALIQQRCILARERAVQRQGKTNQALQSQELDTQVRLEDAAAKMLNVAATRLGWSARSTHRALKVARTIADLAGSAATRVDHLAEAIQYRTKISPR
jgi:magnesium chelatase family protein